MKVFSIIISQDLFLKLNIWWELSQNSYGIVTKFIKSISNMYIPVNFGLRRSHMQIYFQEHFVMISQRWFLTEEKDLYVIHK